MVIKKLLHIILYNLQSILNNKMSIDFNKQLIKKDVLNNILINIDMNLEPKQLYNLLMKDNKKDDDDLQDEIRYGFLYETLSIILLISKCINIDYDNILLGQLQSLISIKNINDILNQKIVSGNNVSDITIKYNNIIVAFSIKYRNKFIPKDTDISHLDNTLKQFIDEKDYKLGLIVKDKKLVLNHNYKNESGIHKELHQKIINNNLLIDENDILCGLKVFCERFKNKSLDEFIELINSHYLFSPRKQLVLKLHQKLTFIKFQDNFNNNNIKQIKIAKKKNEKINLFHLISHKPRSGKSITLLNISKYLLENENSKINKILIMTSVPATINSFINDLETFIDFQNIKYVKQEEFSNISKDTKFKGIVFCSVQYLKINGIKKREYLKNILFDVMIIDECHLGSSTEKTDKEILNVENDSEINNIDVIDDIRENIKLNIFASGTSDKTKKYYKIHNNYIYEWEIEDEGFMKELQNDILAEEKKEIFDIMKNRHGNKFIECYDDITLNKDYSKHPTQVLMKHSIPNKIIQEIKRI
jgi:hypothetical protein